MLTDNYGCLLLRVIRKCLGGIIGGKMRAARVAIATFAAVVTPWLQPGSAVAQTPTATFYADKMLDMVVGYPCRRQQRHLLWQRRTGYQQIPSRHAESHHAQHGTRGEPRRCKLALHHRAARWHRSGPALTDRPTRREARYAQHQVPVRELRVDRTHREGLRE